jgi:hypothetical protein
MPGALPNLLSGLDPQGGLGRQPTRGRGTAGTTGPSANPTPFPRLPQGGIIIVDSGVLSDC